MQIWRLFLNIYYILILAPHFIWWLLKGCNDRYNYNQDPYLYRLPDLELRNKTYLIAVFSPYKHLKNIRRKSYMIGKIALINNKNKIL